MTTIPETKRRTLLDISDDLLALDALLQEAAEETGDITAIECTIAAWFAELSEDRDRKIDNYAALVRDMELRAAARKEEAERLAKRAKADQSRADFLKSRLKQFMEEHGLQKVETDRFCVSVAKNGGKVPLVMSEDNPARLPQEYQRRIVETKADTDKIREALERGEKLPFAELGERGTRLSIR